MSQFHFSELNAESVAFIVDAGNDVEQQVLETWIEEKKREQQLEGAPEPSVHKIVVPIAAEPEDIPSENLAPLINLADSTVVVPIRVVWLKSPRANNRRSMLRRIFSRNRERPSRSRAARILSKDPSRAVPVAARSATLSDLRRRYAALDDGLGGTEGLTTFIAGQATIALDIEERKITGGRYKVPRRVAENIKSRKAFRDAVQRISDEEGIPFGDLQSETDEIMEELIAIPSPFWIDFGGRFAAKLSSLAYDSDIVLNHDDLAKVKDIVTNYPTAFLWTHKTHVDGMAMQKVLYENDFPAAHTFAGINMAFAGIGHMARRSGAIFIRRTFQDNTLYKTILRFYVGYLLEKRFPFSWSFEGTRSRVGKLMPPKYGLLKYLVEAAETTKTKNLHFIPVAINYDLIGDASDYAREQAGEKKRAESLKWFIGYVRGMREPMGRIYMDFGKPVVIEEVPDASDRLAMSKIAFQVGVEVNQVTPITLASIATMQLLSAYPRAMTSEELTEGILSVIDWARARNIRISSDFEIANQQQSEELAEIMIENDLITRYVEGSVKLYSISPEQHVVASYYRNTTVHYFVNKAIAELSLLSVARKKKNPLEAFWAEAERLRDLFKFEFFYSPSDQFHDQINEEISRYDSQWQQLLEADGQYADTVLRRFEPLVAHATLTQFAEAYWIGSTILARQELDKIPEEKEFVEECLEYGRQAYLQRRIRSKASVGKELFKNSYKLLGNLGLLNTDLKNAEQARADVQQDFRKLINRLERIRARALPH